MTASLIVHHGLDKLQHVEGFSANVIAAYFPFLPGPPTFWTYLSAAFEIVGSFCITAHARPAAALIAKTMVNAIAFHLMKFGAQHFPFNPDAGGAYTYEPSLSFLGVSAYLLVAGPASRDAAQRLLRRRRGMGCGEGGWCGRGGARPCGPFMRSG